MQELAGLFSCKQVCKVITGCIPVILKNGNTFWGSITYLFNTVRLKKGGDTVGGFF
jgi:hypothetical protein